MKLILLSLCLITSASFATIKNLQDAPMEWLITSTLQEKIDDHGHLKVKDPLVRSIFKNVTYNPDTDDLIITSNKSTNDLKYQLVDFLDNLQNQKSATKPDQKYYKFLKEPKKSPLKVRLFRTKRQTSGFYYFNHIHTNISQDNADLKLLKITPKKTYKLVERFLKKRRAVGSVAFTDHDSDEAYDKISSLNHSRLHPLRGVEWGGTTHMCLVDIKKDWDELPNGRKYKYEESVIRSRTSGGFRIVNHPNRKKPIFPYTSWLDADGVEVWNTILENSPFLVFKIERSNNRDAFNQWKEALKTGKRYTALAGSDFHFTIPCLKERTLIYPVNYVPANDPVNTRKYLDNGNISFLTRPTAPKLTLKARFNETSPWSIMGDDLKGKGNLTVELFADFSDVNKSFGGACYKIVNSFYKAITFWKKQRWQIRFYDLENNLIAKRNLNAKRYNSKKNFRAEFKLPVNGKNIVRAELWSVNRKSKSIDLLGATNPIYLNW